MTFAGTIRLLPNHRNLTGVLVDQRNSFTIGRHHKQSSFLIGRRDWQYLKELVRLFPQTLVGPFQRIHRDFLLENGLDRRAGGSERFVDAKQLGEFFKKIRRLGCR